MAYKTILAHWADETAPARNFGVAARLAEASNGHLAGLVFGIEPNIAAYSYGAPGAAVITAQSEAAREQAAGLRRAAEAHLSREAISWEVRSVITSIDALSHVMSGHARLCDLVVMELPYQSERDEVSVRALEGALFEGSAPVLACPEGTEGVPGRHVMVAWDRSLEALHAIRHALPFLTAAEKVELTMIDPEPSESGRDDPGADMATMLSRHGVPVELAQVPSAGRSTSEALRKRVTDIGADLVVMGAYGHSRLREALIGGATRDMLEGAPVPVLMAH